MSVAFMGGGGWLTLRCVFFYVYPFPFSVYVHLQKLEKLLKINTSSIIAFGLTYVFYFKVSFHKSPMLKIHNSSILVWYFSAVCRVTFSFVFLYKNSMAQK